MSYEEDHEEYLKDCEAEGVTPVSFEEYKKLKSFRQRYGEYKQECEDEGEEPINLEEFIEAHKCEFKKRNWQTLEAADEYEQKFDNYVKYCKKYGYRVKSFNIWKEEQQQKAAYDDYLKECENNGKKPKSFKQFEKEYNKNKESATEENILKKNLDVVDYINASTVTKDELNTNIPSRFQPVRFGNIIRNLMKNEDIEDITVKDENGDCIASRSKRAFIWVLMERGYDLSRDDELIKKLEDYGSYFEDECVNQDKIKVVLEAGIGIKEVLLRKYTNYYCPNHVAEHIDTHAAHLGLTKDGLAILYILIAVKDYEFSQHVNTDIEDVLKSLYKRLNRQLEDLEEIASKNNVDFSELEEETE